MKLRSITIEGFCAPVGAYSTCARARLAEGIIR